MARLHCPVTVAKGAGEIKIILAFFAAGVWNPAMSDAKRLTELEERYAHLQRHVTEQDKAMLELTEAVTRLRKEIAALRTRVASAAPEVEDAPDERPPHY